MIEVRTAAGPWSGSYEEFERRLRDGTFTLDDEVRFEPVTGDRWVRAGELELVRAVLDGPQARFASRFDLRRPAVVTLITTLLLLLAFGLQLADGPLDGARLVAQGAKATAHQRELGQWWRLLSASWLHASWLHLIPNLLYLLYVGWAVEAVLGRAGTALVLVTSGVAGMAASTLGSPTAAVGASGMAFGTFGAAVALGWRFAAWLPPAVKVRYGWPMVPFVGWFLVAGLRWETVDNLCHLGGLAAGGLLGLFLPTWVEEREGDVRGPASRWMAAALLALVVGVGMPWAWHAGWLPRASLGPTVMEPEAGFSVRPPAGWVANPGDLGAAWNSPTGLARLATEAWIEEEEAPTPETVRRRWIEELEHLAAIVPHSSPPPTAVGLADPWFTLETDVLSADGVLRSLRVGRIRGRYVTTLEFLHDDLAFDTYQDLRRRVFASVELVAPRAITRAVEALSGRSVLPGEEQSALAQAMAAPSASPAATLRLAAELARYGDRPRARRLLDELAATNPSSPEVLYWDLWIDHHLGGAATTPTAAARAQQLVFRWPDSLQAHGLAFDVLLAAGERPAAAGVLQAMKSRWPRQRETRSRLALLPPVTDPPQPASKSAP